MSSQSSYHSFFPKVGAFLIFTILFIISINTQSQRPNIIYIMADDLGYGDLSCYGRKDYATPNLDKLASEGIKFTNAYAAGALCTPTRVAFMTGRYPARTPVGLMEPLRGGPKDSLIGLKPQYTSVATLVKGAGYETALIGKWHLGYMAENSPRANGFNHFFGFHSGAIDYVTHKGRSGKPDLYENEKLVKKDGYFTDLITERSVQYIRKRHTSPFFLSIQFNAAHWPWQSPADKPYPDTMDWINGGSPEIFAGMMKSLDKAVGIILKAIDDAKLSSNTIIIFTSDNGGEKYSNMEMYTGAKHQLWEGGIRVPAFIRWPGKIKPNTTTEQVAVTMDWTAMILALAGVRPDPHFPLDGVDLLPVCMGEKEGYDRTLYWRLFQSKNHKAIRDGKYKYLQTEEGEFLFDLLKDPSEKNNLKEKNTEAFSNLKMKYAEWEKTVLKPIPL